MELSSAASNSDLTVSLFRAVQCELTLLRSELKEKDQKIEILEKKLEDLSNGFKEDLWNVWNGITDLKERIEYGDVHVKGYHNYQ